MWYDGPYWNEVMPVIVRTLRPGERLYPSFPHSCLALTVLAVQMLCEDQVKWFSAKEREHGSLANRGFVNAQLILVACGHLSLPLRFSLCQIFENIA